jgi:predicted DNA-binding transcriptional regulator AlpA
MGLMGRFLPRRGTLLGASEAKGLCSGHMEQRSTMTDLSLSGIRPDPLRSQSRPNEHRAQGAPAERAPLCVDATELATLLHVSERQIYRLDSGGKLPAPLVLGGCRRWSVREIEEWIAAGVPDRRTWTAIRRSET